MLAPLPPAAAKKVRAGERLAEDRNFMGLGHKVNSTAADNDNRLSRPINTPQNSSFWPYNDYNIL